MGVALAMFGDCNGGEGVSPDFIFDLIYPDFLFGVIYLDAVVSSGFQFYNMINKCKRPSLVSFIRLRIKLALTPLASPRTAKLI